MIRGEHVLYGLSGHREVIDTVINRLETGECDFGIRLILTEALINAFNHGNNNDPDKPILLKYLSDGKTLRIEVTDCGSSSFDICIPEIIKDDSILDEKGRGLFLISCYSDKVSFKDSTLTIEKDIG